MKIKKTPPKPLPRPLPRVVTPPQPVAIARETATIPAPDWKQLCKVTLKGDDPTPAPRPPVFDGVQPMTKEEFALHSEREYFRGRKVMGLPPDFSMCPADRHDACLALARADHAARRAKTLGLDEKKKEAVSEGKTKIKVKKQK